MDSEEVFVYFCEQRGEQPQVQVLSLEVPTDLLHNLKRILSLVVFPQIKEPQVVLLFCSPVLAHQRLLELPQLQVMQVRVKRQYQIADLGFGVVGQHGHLLLTCSL